MDFSRGDNDLSSLRQQSLHLYSKPISSLTPNYNTSNATIGLTSTIPQSRGNELLEKVEIRIANLLPRTVLMSAGDTAIGREPGQHDVHEDEHRVHVGQRYDKVFQAQHEIASPAARFTLEMFATLQHSLVSKRELLRVG